MEETFTPVNAADDTTVILKKNNDSQFLQLHVEMYMHVAAYLEWVTKSIAQLIGFFLHQTRNTMLTIVSYK